MNIHAGQTPIKLISNCSSLCKEGLISNFTSLQKRIFIAVTLAFSFLAVYYFVNLVKQWNFKNINKNKSISKVEPNHESDLAKIKLEFLKFKNEVLKAKDEVVKAKEEMVKAKEEMVKFHTLEASKLESIYKVTAVNSDKEFGSTVDHLKETQPSLTKEKNIGDIIEATPPVTKEKDVDNDRNRDKAIVTENENPSTKVNLTKPPKVIINDASEIMNLPQDVQDLDLSNCNNFTVDDIPNLPQGLLELKLNCSKLTEKDIAGLPFKLESLHLKDCENFTHLNFLSKGLKKLTLSNCDSLKHLDLKNFLQLEELQLNVANQLTQYSLPKGLKKLSLCCCKSLEEINALPNTLEELNLWGCGNLQNIDNLPKGLKKLHFESAYSYGVRDFILTDDMIKDLPPQLEDLQITPCHLTHINNIPQSLKKLHLSSCKHLEDNKLKGLPKQLEELIILHCKHLKSMEIKDLLELKKLHFRNCPELKFVSDWPNGIKKLSINDCDLFTNADIQNLPSDIDELNLASSSKISSVKGLPKGLIKLDLSGCESLKNDELNALPLKLEELSLNSCKITNISSLPTGLRKLDLSFCESLTNEDLNFPPELEFLNLSYCKKLIELNNLPKKLKQLQLNNCKSLLSIVIKDLLELEELDMSDCSHLKLIEGIAPKLKMLILLRCKSLTNAGISALPVTIEILNLKESQVNQVKFKSDHALMINI